MRRVSSFLLNVWFVMGAGASLPVLAYDESTHAIITQNAVSRANSISGVSTVLIDLGYSYNSFFVSPDGAAGRADELVVFGSRFEDDLSITKRVFNHFFDPQHDGRGLTVLGNTLGYPSVDWVLEETQELTSLPAPSSPGGVPQLYSYRNAQQHFMAALTASAKATRDREMALTFQTLGHVVHHIQDSAQPQHVRNEAHTPYQPTAPWYEEYTKVYWNHKIPDLLNTPYNEGNIPVFPRARDFWAQPPASGPNFRGMADFTSNNFISLHTNFQMVGGPNNNIRANSEFPQPSGVNHDGSPKRVVLLTLPISTGPNSSVNKTLRYIVGKPYDGYTQRDLPERPLAAVSVFSDPYNINPEYGPAALNDAVFDANYSALLPRASAFSTGIINHFFRGRLELSRTTPTGLDWTIRNAGTQNMSGEFSIYVEDSAGSRYLAVTPWTLALNANASTQVHVPEPAASTQRLVVAFRGQIGAEGSVSSGFFAVAGRSVSFAPQQIQCGGTLRGSGGVGGTDVTWDLGSTAGNVQAEFEAYGIPDEIIISAANGAGTVLARSQTPNGQNGLMSGYRLFTFGFNPQSLGTTSARVRVNAPTDGTGWYFTMKCPGESIDNPDREFPRVPVNFTFGQLLQNAAFSCSAEWFVDGTAKGTVQFSSTAGPAHATLLLSKGQKHWIEFRNYRCDALAVNLIPNVSYIDSAGHTHSTQRMSQTGNGNFDVH